MKRKKSSRPSESPKITILDQFSYSSIIQLRKRSEDLLEYYKDLHVSLASQRVALKADIHDALQKAVKGPMKLEDWCRVLKSKYITAPLSARGSIIDIGQRFNIGAFDERRFLPFYALYIAEDADTGRQEVFCQDKKQSSSLSNYEYALTKETSHAVFRVKGQIDNFIDLNDQSSLNDLIKVFRKIKIPKRITNFAKAIQWEPQTPITDVHKLIKSFLDPNWRGFPNQFGVPANSQIFGELVMQSGIEAIIYPSKFTKKNCAAIFPSVIPKTNSYIELLDEAPLEVKNKRLDKDTYQLFL